MTGRAAVGALIAVLVSAQASAATGWACVHDNEQSPRIEKYIIKGDTLIQDDSDIAKELIPGYDPHSLDSIMRIIENNSRALLAVITSDMAARDRSYTGQMDWPWMSSLFIHKKTGEARFTSTSFVPKSVRDKGEQDVTTGRCTRLD